MADDPLRDLSRSLKDMERSFDAKRNAARMRAVADQSIPDIEEAVRRTRARHGSLADRALSGGSSRIKPSSWARIKLTGEVMNEAGTVVLRPARPARGPMRVLQDGRSAYAKGDRRNSGTYTSKKTGLTKQKTRKVKRTTGAATGKGTWSAALRLLNQRVPDRITEDLVREIGGKLGG